VSKELREEIEKAICSISTFRVLAELAKHPTKTYTKYALSKATMLDAKDVSNAIKKLLEINWIEEVNLGSIKVYKINLNNDKVRILTEFLRKINYI